MLNLIHGITIGLLIASAVLFFNPPEPQIIYECTEAQKQQIVLERLQIALGGDSVVLPKRKPRG